MVYKCTRVKFRTLHPSICKGLTRANRLDLHNFKALPTIGFFTLLCVVSRKQAPQAFTPSLRRCRLLSCRII